MKTAIQLIKEAYEFVGLVPTGKPVSGPMAEIGLTFLNDTIHQLNCDNYFPFTSNTVDGHVSGGTAKISEEPTSELVGPKPIRVNKVLIRNGNGWCALKDVAYENIWERRGSGSSPYAYAFTNDSEGRGIIVFDCEDGDFDCRVIYNKDLPRMEFNDLLLTPPQYESVLKYRVCYLIAVQKHFPPDKQAEYKELGDTILTSIKKANSKKHKIDIPFMAEKIAESPYDYIMIGRHL